MIFRFSFCLYCLLFFLCIQTNAQIVQAKEKTKVLLNAQFIERDNAKDITILRDKVQVILEQNFITCNEAVILWAKNEIVAVGNVLLKTSKSDIKADKIIFNFKDDTGKIFNGTIISGQVLMQGDIIDKTGPESYNADNAYFTSCTTCPSSWSFTADNVDATIEGYAYIKNPWLHIVEVPFLYMPYLVIPLKNDRQTGLLPPSFDATSYSGASIEIPYFWAINRSQDLTFSARLWEKSGPQASLNYRYRLSEKSGGEFMTYYLRDAAYRVKNKARWFTTYAHYLELPNQYIQRTSLNLVSDTEYGVDFLHFPFVGQPALDNRVSITKTFSNFQLSLDSSLYTSLLQENIDAGKETSVHRLPEIQFTLSDQKISDIGNIFFRMNAQYINFSRQSLGYDSPYSISATQTGYRPETLTGVFDPSTDIIRTGQRLDLQPLFYAPQRLFKNTVDFTPYFGYRHTQYVLGAVNEAQNFDFFPHRNYFITGLRTSTELSAIYHRADGSYRHSIIPSIDFQSIPWFSQSNHSFFGSQDQIPYFMQTQPLQDTDLLAEGRGLQFDYEDRIVGRRLVNLNITNRVASKSTTPLGTQYEQPFLFSLSQAYDFIEAKKEDGLPWQDIRGVMNIRTGPVSSFTEAFYFPYHKVTNLSSGFRYNLSAGDFLELAYSNFIIIPARPEEVRLNQRIDTVSISAGISRSYINFFGRAELAPSNEQNLWRAWEVSSEIIPPGRCWSISTRVFKILNSDNFGFNAMVNFKFGS
jgi:LPS-assembly protein